MTRKSDPVQLTASCHCGAVQIEVASRPGFLTECNCSICHRYGALWMYFTRNTAKVISAPDAVGTYSWGDKSIEFHHCAQCGCLTHYESTDLSGAGRIGVNARMLSPKDIESIRVRKFDGANTWKYLDE